MTITVAVILVGGPHHLRQCLEQLLPQVETLPIHIVAPYDDTVSGIADLRAMFPAVDFIDLGAIPVTAPHGSVVAQHERFEKRISAVLLRAKGTHVALLQDWAPPSADWCRHLMDATTLPYAAIGGAIDHMAPALLNWAVYFLDFGRYQSPLPVGPSHFLSDVNIVYRREDLEQIRRVWEQQYNEVLVNWSLRDHGKVLWRKAEMIVRQDRGGLSIDQVLAERFGWGRVFGAARARALPFHRLLPFILFSPLIPFVLTGRIATIVFARKRYRLRFIQALPAVFALAVVWTVGEVVGYLTRRPSPVVARERVQIAN